jgi:hypothetical protein
MSLPLGTLPNWNRVGGAVVVSLERGSSPTRWLLGLHASELLTSISKPVKPALHDGPRKVHIVGELLSRPSALVRNRHECPLRLNVECGFRILGIHPLNVGRVEDLSPRNLALHHSATNVLHISEYKSHWRKLSIANGIPGLLFFGHDIPSL